MTSALSIAFLPKARRAFLSQPVTVLRVQLTDFSSTMNDAAVETQRCENEVHSLTHENARRCSSDG
jgi:hypothetical protein